MITLDVGSTNVAAAASGETPPRNPVFVARVCAIKRKLLALLVSVCNPIKRVAGPVTAYGVDQARVFSPFAVVAGAANGEDAKMVPPASHKTARTFAVLPAEPIKYLTPEVTKLPEANTLDK